jgi:hypothetical protein
LLSYDLFAIKAQLPYCTTSSTPATLTQKTDRGEAEAASEVILENDSMALQWRRDGLTRRWRHSTASLEETVI